MPNLRTIQLVVVTLGLGAAGMLGCSSPASYEFDALDYSPNQDELSEFSLGHYAIPIPVNRVFGDDRKASLMQIEFAFDLYALVSPEFAPQIDDLWQRHEGKVRDRVIRICRNATWEDLQDPELATLKSRLVDAVQDQLGPRAVRRLIVSEIKRTEI
jgi:flagellar basal body-associated protein FliL